MIGFLIKWVINIVALLAVVHIVPGVGFNSIETAVIAALVLGLVNAVLRPVVIFITLPLTILTLGIFTLFINGFMLFIVSKIVKGFVIADFWSAFWGALCFSIVSFLLNIFINPQGKIKMDLYQHNRNAPKRSGVIDVDFKVDDKNDTK
jgi:putative membrane protein